ncbi:TetR/AcrR family transcriptional regulator [Kribbella solani]|uniref:AcrR family transcriptional regulator n=1 Tax=Kribbella solani TaxID=236067 RepID=A0A841DJF8_9ACTN|nr:TetR/AcrR family transcriptional regulator [Kribbella solani]MBB5978021.1 AcrR family transcriptional regulator [Kribbella solani]MDX2970813.1 helix-turn-helix domain containing protein [Kribbella solani]MDX3006789.1 helix-turn-helix domain containing protein [Kribbella solani]
MAITTARERTRHEIVRQAMDLFQAGGYNATSLQDIATAAGCSKATVLYHFSGKPAVLAAVLQPAAVDVANLVAAAAELPRAEAQELAIRQFIDLAVVHRGVVDVIQDVLPVIEQMPEIGPLVADGMQLTEYMAGSDDPLERDLAKFAVNGLLGECRHADQRTDEELRRLCDIALRRLLPRG